MAKNLDDNVQYLKHVGPARAADYAKLGVTSVRDLLLTFPRDMSDRTLFQSIADAPEETPVTIVARAVSVTERGAARRRSGQSGKKSPKSITTAEFTDDSGGILEVVWFNQPWLADKLPGARVLVHGKAKRLGRRLVMEHPLYEILPAGSSTDSSTGSAIGSAIGSATGSSAGSPAESLNFGRIVPVYPCAGALNQTAWRKAMAYALDTRLAGLEETLPEELLARKNFIGRQDAVRAMHFPPTPADWASARSRLVWEECFFMQLAALAARRHALHDLPGRQFQIGPELDSRIRRLFPFRLTPAQSRVIKEIVRDMESPLPMQRLLQGDVGSGKTAVAVYALLAAVANRAQACIMAPTSLLARQHHEAFTRFLSNSPDSRVRLGILVGGMPAAEKRLTLDRLANGTLDIVAATHSAISDSVVFRDLGLVVIDEQHKFGVRQRVGLARKGVRPDTLVMTATPIPRSLALSVYGDLELSTIDSLPPGRKPVKTHRCPQSAAAPAWNLVRRELARGRQGFVVCPLAEESEDSDLASAAGALAELSAGELRGFRLALLHGQMPRREQQETMDAFRAGRLDAVVSTIVIEVGVDVPNATVMVVEHAERFGLAQLHQLRGRVGRGVEQGHFIMLSDARDGVAGERLAAIAKSADGFAIALADLRLRGPGEFTGLRQHGAAGFSLVDLVRDVDVMADARAEAAAVLERDAELTAGNHAALHRELVRLYGKQWDRAAGS